MIAVVVDASGEIRDKAQGRITENGSELQREQ